MSTEKVQPRFVSDEMRDEINALADDWEREHEFTRECMDDDGYRCQRCTDIRALRVIALRPGNVSVDPA